MTGSALIRSCLLCGRNTNEPRRGIVRDNDSDVRAGAGAESRAQDSGQGKGAIVRPTGGETGIMRNPSYLRSDGRIIFIWVILLRTPSSHNKNQEMIFWTFTIPFYKIPTMYLNGVL